MKSIDIEEARAKLPALVEEVSTSREPVEIRKRNRLAAYLIDAATFTRLQGIEDSVRAEKLRRALQGGRYDLDEILVGLIENR